jgi:mRNA-degrading endonuclease toxin of MazEF toxin-antitoxin module
MPTSKKQPAPKYCQWEIWQVRWQHEDGTFKERPALLLSSSAYNQTHDDLWFAKISSVEHNQPFRLELSPADPSFRQTGLTKRCFIYLANARKINKSAIGQQRGRLGLLSALLIGALLKQAIKFEMP